jgi:hypothetical protein
MYLQFIIRFDNTNRMNLEKDALGGLEFSSTDWWIEPEHFQHYQFNIMRNNLQALCTLPKHNKLRQLIIHLQQPEWLPDSEIVTFECDH